MAYDALLKIEQTITENSSSESLAVSGNSRLRGRIDLHEASGQLIVTIEESTNGIDFFQAQQVNKLVQEVGSFGKSVSHFVNNIVFEQPVKAFEYVVNTSPNCSFVRYRFEVSGESPNFEIEINHG